MTTNELTPYAEGRGWTLYAGDCLDVLRRLPAGSVDAVVTDPPYSSGGFTRGDRGQDPLKKYPQSDTPRERLQPSFGGDNRDQRAFLLWSALWLGACLDLVAAGAPIACFTDWRQLPTTTDAVQAGGWVWRGIADWRKPGARPQVGRPSQECEYVVWGSAGPMPARSDVGCLPGFYEAPTPRGDEREHLTQKPLEVMRQIVRICPPGGVILDPFAGSGTTGVAALAEGRRCILIEREPAYLEIAARRLREATADGVQVGMFGGAR